MEQWTGPKQRKQDQTVHWSPETVGWVELELAKRRPRNQPSPAPFFFTDLLKEWRMWKNEGQRSGGGGQKSYLSFQFSVGWTVLLWRGSVLAESALIHQKISRSYQIVDKLVHHTTDRNKNDSLPQKNVAGGGTLTHCIMHSLPSTCLRPRCISSDFANQDSWNTMATVWILKPEASTSRLRRTIQPQRKYGPIRLINSLRKKWNDRVTIRQAQLRVVEFFDGSVVNA